jgi:hypothetical protein
MATTKKATTTKADNANLPVWNTIHIFGYGETQIVSKDHNGKAANSELKTLDALYTSLALKQQKGTKITLSDTHALTIYNGGFVDFRPKSASKNNGQRLDWTEVNAKQIDKLANEIMGKISKQVPRKSFMDTLRKKGSAMAAQRSAMEIARKSVTVKAKKNTSSKSK